MRKKRTLIGVLILCLSVGFASIATNLIINNTTSIGKNINDFDVYFSGAILDGVDKSNELINKSNKKEIYFTSNNLKYSDDESILEYEITNNSSNYDASVNIKCEYTSTDTGINNRITITENPTSLTIEAKSIGNGSITAKLNEMATESIDIPIVCTLTANAVERTSKDTTEMKEQPYSISGYFVNEEGNAISNGYLAVYSSEKHIVSTDIYGYFYVSGLERGMHEIYYLNDLDPESMTKEEIEREAKGRINISTNHKGEIILSNGYKLTDVIVDNKENTHNKYNITLNKDNGEDNETLEVTQNTLYGELLTPSKTGYNFLGWYLDDKIINEEVIVTENNSHTLIAKWVARKYTVTFNANGGSLESEDKLTKEVTYKKAYGSLPEATRENYNFLGWYTSEETQDETTKIEDDTIYNISDNQTLYAGWEAKIIYLYNEGVSLEYENIHWREVTSTCSASSATELNGKVYGPIDVTNYNKLIVESDSSSRYNDLAIFKEKNFNSWYSSTYKREVSNTVKIELNIKDAEGMYYVYLGGVQNCAAENLMSLTENPTNFIINWKSDSSLKAIFKKAWLE